MLRHLSSADSARDLDYLRRALHETRLTYFGWSYGTFLGQVYANLFPRHVRAMVLDGVVDAVRYTRSREAAMASTAAPTDEVFSRFEALCEQAGPDRCALAGHGTSVVDRVNALLAQLRAGPIPAPNAMPPGQLTIGETLTALFPGLRSPTGWPKLAADLEDAAEGDGSQLLTTARGQPPASGSAPPPVAIGCADSPAHQPTRDWSQVINRLTRVGFIAGPVLGWWLWAPCGSWPARSADRYTGPWNAATKHPVVIVGTRYDPNTAYANALITARRLGNATLLTHDGYGHISLTDPSTRTIDAISPYFTGLISPHNNTVCPPTTSPSTPTAEPRLNKRRYRDATIRGPTTRQSHPERSSDTDSRELSAWRIPSEVSRRLERSVCTDPGRRRTARRPGYASASNPEPLALGTISIVSRTGRLTPASPWRCARDQHRGRGARSSSNSAVSGAQRRRSHFAQSTTRGRSTSTHGKQRGTACRSDERSATVVDVVIASSWGPCVPRGTPRRRRRR